MNPPITRNEIIGYIIAIIIGLLTATATYYAPSHAEETRYRLEHPQPQPVKQPPINKQTKAHERRA